MAPKSKRRPRAARRSRNAAAAPTVDIHHPESYISCNMANLGVGKVSGATGTGSLAFNDQLMNAGTSTTGTPIQPGTGTNQRLGRHIYFNRFVARLRLTASDPFRVIVGVNRADGTLANTTTNTNLTAYIEGQNVLEGAQSNIIASGSGGSIDAMISPSTDFEILYDRVFHRSPESLVLLATSTSTAVGTLVEIDLPLNLQRTYTAGGLVDAGSFFIYLCGSDTDTQVSGWMRLQYINQFSFESIGNGICNFTTETGRTIKHVLNSDLLRYTAAAATVFGF